MTKLPTSKTALLFVFFLLFELCHGEISQNCPLPPRAIILINLFSSDSFLPHAYDAKSCNQMR